MKIEGDYLWDKTGEPDPEVQQLEEILGALRYQPRPLEIPAGLQIGRERKFFRGFAGPLAIAATIATLLLGLGLWFGLQRLQRQQQTPQVVKSTADKPQVKPDSATAPASNPKQELVVSSPGPEQKRIAEPPRHRVNPSLLARNPKRIHNAPVNDQLTAKQLQEAAAAKDQLMLAFRLTSAKLNFAQRKAQNTSPRELIHNQHKIG